MGRISRHNCLQTTDLEVDYDCKLVGDSSQGGRIILPDLGDDDIIAWGSAGRGCLEL
jgi:hypothetical protein